jgi:hypothetical protein
VATATLLSDPADGFIITDSLTYASARDGVGGIGTFTATTSEAIAGQSFDSGSGTYYCIEGFLQMDSSIVGAGGTIDSDPALRLYFEQDHSSTNFTLNVAAYDWGGTLTNGAFRTAAQLTALTVLAQYSVTAPSTAAYTSIPTIDGAAFRAAINKTGMTRLIVYSARHAAGTVPGPTLGDEFVDAWYGDEGGSKRPELSFDYTVAAAAGGGPGVYVGGGFYP